ncbi:MAG: hypothetical protein WC755_07760 [Candidatus Woesearchaeota archaeon]|jgi:ElaB/YqjD/DUF883 family membrane-anchored ribosome-binding protein
MANETIRQRTHDGVDKIMDRAENIQEKAIMMKENVDGYIKKNPEKSVFIAVGVGAIIGAIVTAVIMKRKS